jgi:S-adenosylmethionine hydrolase
VLAKEWGVIVNNLEIRGQHTYSDSSPGDLLALVGSHGWVEIAVNRGNAQERLRLEEGNGVRVGGRMRDEG